MNAPRVLYLKLSVLFFVLVGASVFNLAMWGLRREPTQTTWHVPAAVAQRGRKLMQDYGCIGCHVVPGVKGAHGRVGPRLDRFQQRVYIAGVLPNSAQNLVYWMQNPQKVSPESAMPDLSVSEKDARDMAAYLYSLR